MKKSFFNDEFTSKLKTDGWEKIDAGRTRRIDCNTRVAAFLKRVSLWDKTKMSHAINSENPCVSRASDHPQISCKKNWEVEGVIYDDTPYSYLDYIRSFNNTDSIIIAADCLWNFNSDNILCYCLSFLHNNKSYSFMFFPYDDYKNFITIDYLLGVIFDYLNLCSVKKEKCLKYQYIVKLDDKHKPIVSCSKYYNNALQDAKYYFANSKPSDVLISDKISDNHYSKVNTVVDKTVDGFTAYDVTLVLFNGLNFLSSLKNNDVYSYNILNKNRYNLVVNNHGVFSIRNFNISFNSLKKSGYHYMYNANVCIRDVINHNCLNTDDSYVPFGKAVGLKLTDFTKYGYGYNIYKILNKVIECNPLIFTQYAYERSISILLYISSIWGINKAVPCTLISALCTIAQEQIQQVLKTDKDNFYSIYSGVFKKSKLKKNKDDKFFRQGNFYPQNDNCDMLQRYASYAYRGGYNECFSVDIHSDYVTYDVDIASAYPTFMNMVPAINWANPIKEKFENRLLSLDDFIDENGNYNPMKPVFAYVTYQFPDDCLYPNLPGNNSLSNDDTPFYPLHEENGVYCCGAELFVALKKGAKVFAINGFIANILKDEHGKSIYPYRNLVSDLVRERAALEKGCLNEKLLKLMVNSLYGKIAQFVSKMYSDSAEKGYESAITNCVSAALITSSVRAVLFSAFDEIAKSGYHTYSVTTDGLITDMPFDEFNQLSFNGFMDIMVESRKIMTGDEKPEAWSVKHIQNDLLNLSTRKNASLICEDKEKNILGGVIAMGVSRYNPYCSVH